MTTTVTRLYKVTSTQPAAAPRLVWAYSAAQAQRHVAADTITATLATQKECIDLSLAGVKPETARKPPEQLDLVE